MKILSFLNVSNKDDIQCDSGYVFQRIISAELTRLGHDFSLVSPIPVEGDHLSNIAHDFGANKFQVRFKFDWDRISSIIDREEPDLLWINQPELASNFRAVLCTLGSKARIITYLHYLPVQSVNHDKIELDESLNNSDLGLTILLAVLSSVGISDKLLVQSQFARNILTKSLQHFRIPFDDSKIQILPPPYDPQFFNKAPIKHVPKKHIMYNHRLYRHYGTDFLLKVIHSLEDKEEVRFLVADLLSSRNISRRRLDRHVDAYRSKLRSLPNVILAKNTSNRTFYKNAIRQCRAGLAAHRQMAVWSMSAVDCLGMGVPVIAPNFACYPEFIPDELLYNSEDDLRLILDRLLESEKFWKDIGTVGKERILPYSPERIAQNFAGIIEND